MYYFPPDGMSEGRRGLLKSNWPVMVNAFASLNFRPMDFFVCCYHVFLGTTCTSKKQIIIICEWKGFYNKL